MHSHGALLLKLCTRKFLYAPSQYITIIHGSKNVHTPGVLLRKSCTRPWKCARRVQGAPLILDTGWVDLIAQVYCWNRLRSAGGGQLSIGLRVRG